MVAADYLSDHSALSRGGQPNFAALLRTLGETDDRITLVIGAGLSIDSGFPSWNRLLSAMTASLPQDPSFDLAKAIRDDTDGPLRKAEQILSIIKIRSGYEAHTDVIRRALYDGMPATRPGPVVKSISRLIAENPERFAIITTNFDDVLDTALAARDGVASKIFGLEKAEQWRNLANEKTPIVPILHLHGRVTRRAKDTKLPIILGESDFLRYGARAQDVIKKAVDDGIAVFLGLSLTDPNVIGSLWDGTHKPSREMLQPRRAFAVAVPGIQGRLPIDHSQTYAILKSKYIDDALGLQSIFLKSYTQLDQLIHECRIVMRSPTRYFETGASSIAYGPRFTRLLEVTYASIRTPDESGSALSTELRQELRQDSPVAQLLNRFRSNNRTLGRLSVLRKAYLEAPDRQPQELFALSLWLRVPRETVDNEPPYAIRFIASSDFVQQSTPILLESVPIAPDSDSAPARALARGMGIFWNSTLLDSFSRWGGVAASLLRVREEVDGVTVTTPVGAICLHSNFHYVGSKQPTDGNVTTVSILSALDSLQRASLQSELEKLGQDLLTRRLQRLEGVTQ